MELQWKVKMMMATEETLLYSGMDEGERHERVGLILLKDAAQSLLERKPVPEGMSSTRSKSRW